MPPMNKQGTNSKGQRPGESFIATPCYVIYIDCRYDCLVLLHFIQYILNFKLELDLNAKWVVMVAQNATLRHSTLHCALSAPAP